MLSSEQFLIELLADTIGPLSPARKWHRRGKGWHHGVTVKARGQHGRYTSGEKLVRQDAEAEVDLQE